MPFMDGTGPRWQYESTRTCGCRHAGRHMHGFGAQRGAGVAYGFGGCRMAAETDREGLTAQKEWLNARLADVESKLKSL